MPLIFNLNAALPWQLAILPGMTAEATTRVYERIEKAPIATLEDLSGKIPAETFAVLELVQLP